MKKVVLLALMLAMVLAVSVPAAANGNTGNFVSQQGSVTYGTEGNVVQIGDGHFGEQRAESGKIDSSVVITN